MPLSREGQAKRQGRDRGRGGRSYAKAHAIEGFAFVLPEPCGRPDEQGPKHARDHGE